MEINAQCTEKIMLLAECNVYRWVEQFNEGRMTAHDKDQSGRPSTTVNEETVNIVRAILNEEDRRNMLDDFHHNMAIQYSYDERCHTSIFNILTNELEMRKVCACRVPRELSDLHQKERIGTALEFLTMYREEGNALFDRIIMGDEMLVHYWTPKSKAASMQWMHKDKKSLNSLKRQIPQTRLWRRYFGTNRAYYWSNTYPEAECNPRDIFRQDPTS